MQANYSHLHLTTHSWQYRKKNKQGLRLMLARNVAFVQSRVSTLQHCHQSMFVIANLIFFICHKVTFLQRSCTFYTPFSENMKILLISLSPNAALKIISNAKTSRRIGGVQRKAWYQKSDAALHMFQCSNICTGTYTGRSGKQFRSQLTEL